MHTGHTVFFYVFHLLKNKRFFFYFSSLFFIFFSSYSLLMPFALSLWFSKDKPFLPHQRALPSSSHMQSLFRCCPQFCRTLATWCEERTHWKRPWCWERLKAKEGDNRGWDGWMASPTWWIWVWASSRSWWWTGKPGVLQSMGSQRVGQDRGTELNWCNILILVIF